MDLLVGVSSTPLCVGEVRSIVAGSVRFLSFHCFDGFLLMTGLFRVSDTHAQVKGTLSRVPNTGRYGCNTGSGPLARKERMSSRSWRRFGLALNQPKQYVSPHMQRTSV